MESDGRAQGTSPFTLVLKKKIIRVLFAEYL